MNAEEQIKREGIVEKAKKLINLQERAATPGEALAAAKALAGLLDKHRIALTELETDGQTDREAFVADKDEPLYIFQRVQVWRRDLCFVLGKHFGVATWQRTRHFKDRRPSVHFICACGRPTDIELMRGMYVWLSREIESLSTVECRGMGTRYANSWRMGFVVGLDKQLADLRTENTAESTTAMVLYGRIDEAQKYLESLFEHMGSVAYKSRAKYDPWAFQSGYVRGLQHNLGGRLPESSDDSQPE